MSEVMLHTIIVKNEEIATADLDNETVMMSIETGNYYNLGKIGSVIWKMLDRPIAVETLIQNLLDKYQVNWQQCEKEVLEFLNEISKEGLIIIK